MKTTIKNILEMCEKYSNGGKEFEEFLEALNIFKRLSMYKKGMLVSMAMTDLDGVSINIGLESDSAEEIERIYIIRFLLSYIDLEDEFYPINGDDIENIYSSGLADYVVDRCERDYDIIKRMFENSIKIKYLAIFSSNLDGITSDKNEENVNMISEIFSDKETIKNVIEIMQYNDPAMKEIKDKIYAPIEQKK